MTGNILGDCFIIGVKLQSRSFIKILGSHPDFDMKPLFEWDFKVLPHVIGWLERAAACPIEIQSCAVGGFNGGFEGDDAALAIEYQANIENRKLSGIYQFIRGMPTFYIETVLIQELNRVRHTKKRLQRELEEAEMNEKRILKALSSRNSRPWS